MNLAQKIERLHTSEHKLLLIVGGPGSGKSKVIREYSNETGVPMLDLDMIFQHTPTDKLVEEMKQFLSTYRQPVLLLDNKKILYAKDSAIDLLEFLKAVSTDKPVVATWNGKVEDGQLFHFRKDSDDLIYPVNDEVVIVEC